MSALDWISLGLDFCPVVGEVKSLLELIIGKDVVTQEDLNAFDRATSAIAIIPVAGWLAKFLTLLTKANKASSALDKVNIIRQILQDCGINAQSITYTPQPKPSTSSSLPKTDFSRIESSKPLKIEGPS